MMKKAAIIIFTAITLFGCSGLKKNFPKKNLFNIEADSIKSEPYTSENSSKIKGVDKIGIGAGLIVRQFTILPEFDSNYFIYRISPNQYIYDYYNNFIVSPSSIITDDIGKILYASSYFKRVNPNEFEDIKYRLWGSIINLYGDMQNKNSPEAVMTIRIVLEKKTETGFKSVINKIYPAEVLCAKGGARGLVDAWGICLERIMSNFYKDFINSTGKGTYSKRLGYNSINSCGACIFRVSNIRKSR